MTFTSGDPDNTLLPGLTVAVGCPAAVSIIFSGSVKLQNATDSALTANMNLNVQYYNTLLPATVFGTLVPVAVSLTAPANSTGPSVPVTASLDVTLSPGTYVVQVTFSNPDSNSRVVVATGTLNAIVTKSASPCC